MSVASLLPGADTDPSGPASTAVCSHAPQDVVFSDTGVTEVLFDTEDGLPRSAGIAPSVARTEPSAAPVQQSDSPTGSSCCDTKPRGTKPDSSPAPARSTPTSTATPATEEVSITLKGERSSQSDRTIRPQVLMTAHCLDPQPALEPEVEQFLEDLRRSLPGDVYSLDEAQNCMRANGQKFCGPIRVASMPRRLDKTGRSMELEFLDCDRDLHRVVVSRATMKVGQTSILKVFPDRGFECFCDPLEVLAFLQAWLDVPGSWMTEQAGWFTDPVGRASYIRADGKVHQPAAATPVVLSMPDGRRVESPGTLKGWQDEVATRALGNPALVFVISAALTGPLLRLADIRTCGFNFFGTSSVGKSLLLEVALSCGGDPGRLVPWTVAQTGLHALSVLSQDGLIALDGFPRDPDARHARALLAVADDAGFGRIVSPRDPDGARRWRRVLLSSSELPLSIGLRRNKKEPPAAFLARVVDLPAAGGPHGVIADLHGSADGVTFARSLRAALRRQHGHLLPAFLDRLVSGLDAVEAQLIEDLSGMTAAVQDQSAADALISPAGQPRIAERFALVAFAGELAARWGLLPWPPGTATEAATHMAGLRRPNGLPITDAAPSLARLSAFVATHHHRIIDLEAADGPDDTPADAIGWQDDKHLYLAGGAVRDRLADLDALLDQLKENDALVPGGEQRSLQYRMPATKVRNRPRVYRFDKEKLGTRNPPDADPTT